MKKPIDRRQLTQLGLGTALFNFAPRLARAETREPTPDFEPNGDIRFAAGIRPYRNGTFRLEPELLGERLIVHNYGHGGAGITMSWGCAHEIRDHVRDFVADRPDARAVVLGAGAMGLTAATLLVEMGLPVTVYAKGFCEETTSHVAGGQFAPSTVAYDHEGEGFARFQRILRRSFRTHEERIGRGFGVVRRRNYTWSRLGSFAPIPADVVPPPTAFDALPFAGHERQPGFCYQTLLVEPPIFLRRLELDLRLAGVRLLRRELHSLDEMLALPNADVIVNCMGLGAGAVLADPAVVPVRGQLVHLRPQPELDYLYNGPPSTYIFLRSDVLLIGGTRERGEDDPTPQVAACEDILARARAPFEGRWEPARIAPDWQSS